MPWKALQPCATPGCPEKVRRGHCDFHARKRAQEQNARRETAAQRGYDSRWWRESRAYLAAHPLCVGVVVNPVTKEPMPCGAPATVVDHRTPHRGDQTLFWDRSNWQPMCKHCHDRKTAKEDGRWQPRAY